MTGPFVLYGNLINADGGDDHIAESDVRGSALAASFVLEKIIDELIELKFDAVR